MVELNRVKWKQNTSSQVCCSGVTRSEEADEFQRLKVLQIHNPLPLFDLRISSVPPASDAAAPQRFSVSVESRLAQTPSFISDSLICALTAGRRRTPTVCTCHRL